MEQLKQIAEGLIRRRDIAQVFRLLVLAGMLALGASIAGEGVSVSLEIGSEQNVGSR